MMIPSLNRINELAKKAKTEGLTEAEKQEQAKLRKEYLKEFRGSIDNILLNSKIVDPTGRDITPKKLKEKQQQHNIDEEHHS